MEQENNFDVNFKKLLSDDKEINKILDRIDGECLMVEDILSTYEKNSNRYGVILTATSLETGKLQKIIIDAIYGEPNSTQVKELTYGDGSDFGKRIIFYTLGHPDHKEREYEYDGQMAEGFAKINNDCGLDIYIFKISLVSDKTYKSNAVVTPDDKRRTLHKILPTLQEFEQAEFGVIYNYSSDWKNPHYIEHPENWYDNYWHEIYHDISFRYPIWNEGGLFMLGVSKSEIGDVTLKWLMDSKIEVLKKFFSNREINIDTLPSGRSIMEIKFWDKPFSCFTRSTVEEKEMIAEAIRGYDSVTFEFLDNLFGRRMTDEEVLKDLGPILEDAFKELEKEILNK